MENRKYCLNLGLLKINRMRFRFFVLLALAPAVFCAAKGGKLPELTVMSYNIRTGDANDGTNSWQFRYPATAIMIDDQKPDVMGVQEALPYQLNYIEEFCRGYKYVGESRDGGKKKGEHAAIVYNKKTVSVLKWGTFWLSETPDEPSVGWDAAFRRTATWALMKSKVSGKQFIFVNTHLDHQGAAARENGIRLIMERIKEINMKSLPVVLAGDFNAAVSDPALSAMSDSMKNARRIAAETDSVGTFHDWGKASSMIDHIFYSGFRSCTLFETVTDSYSGRRFISDHYPVKAVLVF